MGEVDAREEDARPVIYSIGTSTRSWDEFVTTLKAYGVEIVADVRSFPMSRRFPHFGRAEMEKHLPQAGIEYHYFGRNLGGYRKGGYEAHSASEQFAQGLQELETLARWQPTAFMCAERMPWKCHRRHIGAKLQERGWHVIHILDSERTWEFTY